MKALHVVLCIVVSGVPEEKPPKHRRDQLQGAQLTWANQPTGGALIGHLCFLLTMELLYSNFAEPKKNPMRWTRLWANSSLAAHFTKT